MPKIKRGDHLAINVRSLKESLIFYRDVLGMEEEETVKMDGFTITYLEAGNFQLELFNYEEQIEDSDRKDMKVGFRHFAFEVDCVDEWYSKLREGNVEFKLTPSELDKLGVKVMLVKDPNGIIIELSQPL